MAIGLASWWPLLLLPLVPLIGWLAWRFRRGMGRRRATLVVALRSLTVMCVIVALAGPGLQSRTNALSVIFALDVSHSVVPESLRAAMQWIQETTERFRPAHAGYLVFADRAALLARPEDIASVAVRASSASRDRSIAALDQGATDLERGLAAALVGFRPGHAKRLVLISDGQQTQGDVWRQLPRLQGERVRVFTLPAPTRVPAEAWIDGVSLPTGIRAQEPVTARIRLGSTTSMRARLELQVADAVRLKRSVTLDAGTHDVTVDLRFLRVGENAVKVSLALPNGRTETSLSSVRVGPRPRVLHVEGGRTGGRYLADALTVNGIDVVSLTVEQFAGNPAAALDPADAVVLSDVRADAIDEAANGVLQTFVRDHGGGLVFIAGEHTYGKGGFSGGTLEEMLPIRFEARRRRNDLDLVLLIDRSYSMRGDRLEMAKTAALATLDLMEPQHRLAVVAFDSRPHDVVRLAPVGTRRRAEDAIGSIGTGGRTDVYNALRRAHELLKDSESKTRHVILLTDGQSAPPPNAGSAAKPSSGARSTLEGLLRGMGYSADHIRRLLNEDGPERSGAATGGYEDLAAEMVRAGITLSTVAIGEEPNLLLLASLAAQGNGKSYVAQRDSEIPGLFVTEARRLLGESLVEAPFRPVVTGASRLLTGVDFATGPELKGFVATKPKRFADVLLQAGDEAPLLVQTRYGLGRTVAFLSDAKNRWARDWLGWPGYGRFWSQVVRDAARRLEDHGLTWQVVRKAGAARIELTALDQDGSFRNALWPKVRVRHPAGGSTVVMLRQSAPGTYAASVPLRTGAQAPTSFELLPGPGLSVDETARLGTRTVYYPNLDEFHPRAPDLALLQALSERTGGRFAPAVEEIFAPSSDGGTQSTALWPLLAGVALLLFLFEIAARRVPWAALDGAALRH
jgi:Ca-activated chloride channel homolog